MRIADTLRAIDSAASTHCWHHDPAGIDTTNLVKPPSGGTESVKCCWCPATGTRRWRLVRRAVTPQPGHGPGAPAVQTAGSWRVYAPVRTTAGSCPNPAPGEDQSRRAPAHERWGAGYTIAALATITAGAIALWLTFGPGLHETHGEILVRHWRWWLLVLALGLIGTGALHATAKERRTTWRQRLSGWNQSSE